MKRFGLGLMVAIVLAMPAVAADDDTPPQVAPRVSIFSTSTDWEGLTGLQLNEYRIKFVPDSKLIGRQGLVLYYLDGFPCYGLGFGVRVWLGPNGKDDGGKISIACVYPPTEVKFTWRNATRDADQAVSTGMLTCPVKGDRELTVDLSKCVKDKDWTEYK